MDCIFCKIIAGDIPSRKLYEDDRVLAFYDISPMAKTHFLVVPKQHIASAQEITPDNSGIIAHIFEVIARLAAERGLADGYRVVTNVGDNGCQSVKHLHFHVLGGEKLSEKLA